jgi:hypothetical protein
MGEAIAVLKGLEIALQYSLVNLIIETDCLSIVQVFKEDSLDRSELCMIAKEFRIKKPPDRQVSIMKTNRSCNKVAHELCQFSRRVLSGGDCNPNLVS